MFEFVVTFCVVAIVVLLFDLGRRLSKLSQQIDEESHAIRDRFDAFRERLDVLINLIEQVSKSDNRELITQIRNGINQDSRVLEDIHYVLSAIRGIIRKFGNNEIVSALLTGYSQEPKTDKPYRVYLAGDIKPDLQTVINDQYEQGYDLEHYQSANESPHVLVFKVNEKRRLRKLKEKYQGDTEQKQKESKKQ